MKNENNTSAKKKLIPAIAALATSAVMLSTSTYAWFTMNKTAEVTGLQMSATAGDSLEISLGEITGTTPSNDAPSINSISWKKSIDIDEYYASVGKLMPASSDTSLTLYSVENSDVYAGGTKVKSDAIVSEMKQKDSVTLTLDGASNTDFATSNSEADEGYYLDVPMWIRTTKSDADSTVYCTVTINDASGKNLKNAVRVAIIPIGTAMSETGGTDGILSLTLTGSAGYEAESTTSSTLTKITNPTVLNANPTIFGLTNGTYTTGKTLGANGTFTSALKTTSPIATTATSETYDSATSENTAVFTIPQADANSYSGVSFIARVWLEGESTFCSDLTAGQDWNIDFHFSLDPIPAP